MGETGRLRANTGIFKLMRRTVLADMNSNNITMLPGGSPWLCGNTVSKIFSDCFILQMEGTGDASGCRIKDYERVYVSVVWEISLYGVEYLKKIWFTYYCVSPTIASAPSIAIYHSCNRIKDAQTHHLTSFDIHMLCVKDFELMMGHKINRKLLHRLKHTEYTMITKAGLTCNGVEW